MVNITGELNLRKKLYYTCYKRRYILFVHVLTICSVRFDIRLMKEGRMKGQAFVTLPSEKVSVTALKDTNGFILKDKPIVVVSFSAQSTW